MAFRFSLALLGAILLNGAVLGGDSTCSGALAGADGERNAPSRGGDAGCKSEGRARNDDKLVILDSVRTTPSEAVRKSASVVKGMSDQSSHSSHNEARNDHVGVGNELPEQPATSHKAQTSADDKHGMKLPRARRPAASRHSEGGLTTTSPKESAEVLDRKKEFESMVSGIIAEEAENSYQESYDPSYTGAGHEGKPYAYDYESLGNAGQSGYGDPPVGSSSVNSTSTSGSAPGSTTNTASSPDSGQSSATRDGDEGNTNNEDAPKDVQDKEEKEKENEKEDGNEEGKKQPGEQKNNENSDEQETNNSSEDAENEKTPSWGNSAFLCGSYSSVLLVAVACLCACAC
ncbi:hypothetical protein TRVL_09036 [Trypanosoma vivax]|nr:hypothetical protein TRVL_09036 [Trypanosoma vivax]